MYFAFAKMASRFCKNTIHFWWQSTQSAMFGMQAPTLLKTISLQSELYDINKSTDGWHSLLALVFCCPWLTEEPKNDLIYARSFLASFCTFSGSFFSQWFMDNVLMFDAKGDHSYNVIAFDARDHSFNIVVYLCIFIAFFFF